MKTRQCLALSVLLAMFLIGQTQRAHAAIKTWTGGGAPNGNWTVGANWGGTVPMEGDSLIFPPGVALVNTTNNFPSNTVFSAINIGGVNYAIYGNLFRIINGITATNGSGTNTIVAPIRLNNSMPITCFTAGGTLVLNGGIDLNLGTVTFQGAGTNHVGGLAPIYNNGNVVKTGSGTLRLATFSANVYSGTTTVDEGVLELNTGFVSPAVAIPGGNLNIGRIVPPFASSTTVRLLRDDQIADTAQVFIEHAILDLNDHSDTVGPLTLDGALIRTGLGTLTLNGDVRLPADDDAEIYGRLSLGSATRVIDIPSHDGGLNIHAELSGNAGTGFIKNGLGSLYLLGTNSYTGPTTVDAGFLAVFAPLALGSASPGTVVNAGATLAFFSPVVIPENLTLNGSGADGLGALRPGTGTNGCSGSIILNSDTSIGALSNTVVILNGPISGSGKLTKMGSGALRLTGSSANSYGGGTVVTDGTLELGKTSGAIAVPGPLFIGDVADDLVPDVVRLLGNDQLPPLAAVTLIDRAQLHLNGFNQSVGSLVLSNGFVFTGLGTLLLNGDVNEIGNDGSVIAGRMSLGSAPRTFTVDELSISANISGGPSADFIVRGTLLELGGSNSYAGLTRIEGAQVELEFASFGLGSTNAGTIVTNGGALRLCEAAVVNEPLTISGAGHLPFGALAVSCGETSSWSGPITLAADTVIGAGGPDNALLVLSGQISGAGGVTKVAPGMVRFSGPAANTYTGGTIVNEGVLALAKPAGVVAIPGSLLAIDPATTNLTGIQWEADHQIADPVSVTVNGTGGLELMGFNEAVGLLSGSGTINTGFGGNFTNGVNNGSSIFSGTIRGSGTFAKSGNGRLTLTGTNTGLFFHTGVVNGGRLLVDGVYVPSTFVVNQSGTLGGNGSVGGVNVHGIVAPGTSPGRLTVLNSIAFTSTGTFRPELEGTTPGVNYDQLNVTGSVSLANCTLNVLLGFAPAQGDQFVIINNDGSDSVSGTFNGLPQGSSLTVSGLQFRVSYAGGTGNDVVLTVTNVPLNLLSTTVNAGNGNALIDRIECNDLYIVLTNSSTNFLGAVGARLTTSNPDVVISQSVGGYGNIPAGGLATNQTPFQIRTLRNFSCLTPLELRLNVLASGGAIQFAIPLTLTAGCGQGSGECEGCPGMFVGAITAGDSFQTGKLNPGQRSSCDTVKTCPGLANSLAVRYDAYTFTNAGENSACVTVALETTCGDDTIFAAAYRAPYDPGNPCANYLGDIGNEPDPSDTFSFIVAEDDVFVIVVHEALPNIGCTNYSLNVTGLECPPPQLGIHRLLDPAKVLLDWTTGSPGFQLEAAPNLDPSPLLPFQRVTNPPVVVNSRYTVTNNLEGDSRFYRLRKP